MNLICVYLLIHKSYKLSALFLMISYYFDMMDGYIARKYDQVTEFGDWFDHISDLINNKLAPTMSIVSNIFSHIFKNVNEKNIYSRFFGAGMYMTMISLLILIN